MKNARRVGGVWVRAAVDAPVVFKNRQKMVVEDLLTEKRVWGAEAALDLLADFEQDNILSRQQVSLLLTTHF